jgi:hypothetical protein
MKEHLQGDLNQVAASGQMMKDKKTRMNTINAAAIKEPIIAATRMRTMIITIMAPAGVMKEHLKAVCVMMMIQGSFQGGMSTAAEAVATAECTTAMRTTNTKAASRTIATSETKGIATAIKVLRVAAALPGEVVAEAAVTEDVNPIADLRLIAIATRDK